MIKLNDHQVQIIKTTKIPVDEGIHALPPFLEELECHRVKDYKACPEDWSREGFFAKVEDELPLWFNFIGNEVCAILPSVQRLNPVDGAPANLDEGLKKSQEYPWQNYLKMPEQKWLDGYSKDGKVYQFCVTRDESGLAVSDHVLPKYLQGSHAVAFAFFDPVNPPPREKVVFRDLFSVSMNPVKYSCFGPNPQWVYTDCNSSKGFVGQNEVHAYCMNHQIKPEDLDNGEVGMMEDPVKEEYTSGNIEQNIEVEKASMAAGGRIQQRIERDENTLDYWKKEPSAIIVVYFAFGKDFDKVIRAGKSYDGSSPKSDAEVDRGFVGKSSFPLLK